MHWLTLLGIVVVAIGTLLMVIGSQQLANESDAKQAKLTESSKAELAQQVDAAIDRIQHLRTDLPAAAQSQADAITDELRDWANGLISDGGVRRSELEKVKLSHQQRELERSVPMLVAWSAVSKSVHTRVKALNSREGPRISLAMKDAPPNLVGVERVDLGTIDFPSGSHWTLTVTSSPDPGISIRRSTTPGGRASSTVSVFNFGGMYTVTVIGDWTPYVQPGQEGVIPDPELPNRLDALVQRLLEYETLELGK